MHKAEAQKLVRETLQSSFNKERFVYLVKNILNHIEETPLTYEGNFIRGNSADTIKCVERVGTYNSPDKKHVDILVVHLTKDTSLDRARTKQRNFVAKYLKDSVNNVRNRDAALVAFVDSNTDDWRFSLVTMKYKFNDKGKVEEEFTPARRYSFLVGKNENSHTAQSRLLPLLLDDQTPPTLADLENAFSVERVTKEFFEKYHALFLRLKESLDETIKSDPMVNADFQEKHIDTADFAKKLLGQIVFLYFLQKKGWFGVKRDQEWGSGSKHFLRELFAKKHGNYENFFNDILEPLFYEALRSERSGDYYSRFDCRIPFLNGGLFDPINDYNWWKTNILLPNEIFSNHRQTEEGDIGDGILDIFDRYNFTVKEDEPLEKEVAVDPEMLGKVFENLLEVKDRKSKGTYYTPREIVHYMCQESLVNYLATELEGKVSKEDIDTLIKYGDAMIGSDNQATTKNQQTTETSFQLPQNVRKYANLIDEKLASIRVCDPAVGSGAFLVGMMNEIVHLRNALTVYIGQHSERTAYHFKRQAIENCLYGVDIDQGAVEIAKLRLWLSLVVDEEERQTIQPLPNLDYKILQGNSLLGIDKDLFNHDLFDELEKLKRVYFNETRVSEKQKRRQEINNLIREITKGHEEFDFQVYFSEVFHEKGGFDVVIGNPPYIQLQKAIDNTKKYADLYHNQKYSTFDRTGDIYCLFYEKGLQLLKQGGILAYITSNKWMRAGYGEKLRKFFIRYNPLQLIDLGPGVFESATVDTNILIIQNTDNQKQLKAVTLQKEDQENIAKALNEKGVVLSNLTKDAWFIGSDAEQHLKEKIERLGKPLKDWDVKIYRGIVTGLNEAFIITTEKRNEILANCQDEAERQRTEAIIKPILRGRDIKRYYYEWAGLWVIGTFPALKLNIDDYPALKKYFLENFDIRQLEQSGKKYPELGFDARKKTGNKWFETQDQIAYYSEFEKEKVVWGNISYNSQFSFVEEGVFINAPANLIVSNSVSIKFLVGLMNSKIFDREFKRVGIFLGHAFEWKKQYVEQVKIPPITPANEPIVKQIEELVDKILEAKKENHEADTSHWEREIDELVCKLYELTEEEKRIIENKN